MKIRDGKDTQKLIEIEKSMMRKKMIIQKLII